VRNVQPRGLLLDIDGTVLDSGRLIEGAGAAIATLRARRVPLLFATNTSRKSRAAVARSLRDVGLPVEDADVLSASAAAAVTLRARGVRKLCALLAPAALPDFDGFELVDEGAEAVVVGDMGAGLTYELLNTAFRCLLDGARLVATHRNRYWKADDGRFAIDAGAFIAALEYAAQVEAELVGKPAPGFFRAAADVLGLPAADLAIVGDDLEADIAGGRAAGLTTFAVRTGKFRDDDLAATPPDRTPHRVLDSVREVVAFFPG
jgi:HAD superfamily hydrolase (TIGR01458 family)